MISPTAILRAWRKLARGGIRIGQLGDATRRPLNKKYSLDVLRCLCVACSLWYLKAAIQGCLALLPRSHVWNRFFQDYVTGSLPLTERLAERFQRHAEIDLLVLASWFVSFLMVLDCPMALLIREPCELRTRCGHP